MGAPRDLKVNTHADLRGELQKIGVPTLIVARRSGRLCAHWPHRRKSAAFIGGATLIVYPGAGHGLYASDPTIIRI